MKLRSYQEEAINLVRSNFARHRSIVLQLPTGAGKSFVAMTIIQRAISKGSRVAFVVDGVELLEQASATADEMGIDHGVMQSNHWRRRPSEKLQICTIQTLRSRGKDFALAVIDECHAVFKSQLDWMKKFDGTGGYNKTFFLGLSATPFAKSMGLHWDALIKTVSTQDLIDEGTLSDFTVFAPTKPDLTKVGIQAGDFNKKQLGDVMTDTDLTADIVKTWHEKAHSRPTVAFCVDISHAELVASQFRAVGVSAAAIHSKITSEKRIELITDFKSGKITVMANCMVLTKGFDHPAVSCLILARPTKSLMVFYQQVGRGLRTANNKRDCIILDHAGNHNRLGFATDDTPDRLSLGTKAEAKKIEEDIKPAKECSNCKLVLPRKRTSSKCPHCGHIPKKPTVETEVSIDAKGKLTALQRNALMPPKDKLRFYSELLGYAKSKNYNTGWADHKHNERFGHFPAKKKGVVAVKPSKETVSYIRHLQIKYNKGKKYGNKHK